MFAPIFLVYLFKLTCIHSYDYHNYSNLSHVSSSKASSSLAVPSLPVNTETTHFESIDNFEDENIQSFEMTGSLHRFLSTGTPNKMIPTDLRNGCNTIPDNNLQYFPREVIAKRIFIVQPQVKTIQNPEYIGQDNIPRVIQKPEFLIEEIPEILRRPESLVQEEFVRTTDKPIFLVQEQVNVVQKPEFAIIQEEVNVNVKPDLQLEEITEVIPKPTLFVVEENFLPVQKPTFVIDCSQEVDIVIAPVPVTIQKTEYQVAENTIPAQKPAFLVRETQGTTIKPEYVITEEVVQVPRPNFLVREDVQVIEKPNFLVQDVVETVQKPEYNVEDSNVFVQKPEFFIEDVIKTVKPSFVEQADLNHSDFLQEEIIPVPKPQFVKADTVVPVVVIDEIQEVMPKLKYLIEDFPIPVDKPTYLIEETEMVVQKPNFAIQEVMQTVPKPKYSIQEAVEVITKPEFIIQEDVETIIKPKFVVISASNPTGEVFDASKYKSSIHSTPANEFVESTLPLASRAHSKQTVQNNPITSNVYPDLPHIFSEEHSEHNILKNVHHLSPPPLCSQKESVVIPPSIKPQIIEGIEFSLPLHGIKFPSPYKKSYINKTFPLNFQKKTVIIPPSIKPNNIRTIEEFSNPIDRVQGPLHFEEIPSRVQSNNSGFLKSTLIVKSDGVEIISPPHSRITPAPLTPSGTLEVVNFEVAHLPSVPNDPAHYQNHRHSTSVEKLDGIHDLIIDDEFYLETEMEDLQAEWIRL